MTRFKGLVRLLLCAAYLASGVQAGSEVICISPGGHFELEPFGAECCTRTASPGNHVAGHSCATLSSLGDPGPCDGCVDLPKADDSVRPLLVHPVDFGLPSSASVGAVRGCPAMHTAPGGSRFVSAPCLRC